MGLGIAREQHAVPQAGQRNRARQQCPGKRQVIMDRDEMFRQRTLRNHQAAFRTEVGLDGDRGGVPAWPGSGWNGKLRRGAALLEWIVAPGGVRHGSTCFASTSGMWASARP